MMGSFHTLARRLYSSSISFTSFTDRPEPRETLLILDGSENIFKFVLSNSVMKEAKTTSKYMKKYIVKM